MFGGFAYGSQAFAQYATVVLGPGGDITIGLITIGAGSDLITINKDDTGTSEIAIATDVIDIISITQIDGSLTVNVDGIGPIPVPVLDQDTTITINVAAEPDYNQTISKDGTESIAINIGDTKIVSISTPQAETLTISRPTLAWPGD